MKKNLILALALLVALLVLPACSSGGTVATQPPAATETLAPQAPPTARPTTYKESMLPFDQLVPGARIVILQNALNYTREGFYTPETKPATQEISYNGGTVAAYPISYTLAFLTNGSTGPLKIVNNDGSQQEISAEEFAGLYVIIDFASDAPPVLVNPETGTELKDFLYAVTAEGESIYSVVSGATINAAEMIANAGWDPAATYRYMATDKFYFPVGPAEAATGEVRGTLSGAVNGSFPDLKIASGKINDLLYIEALAD